MTELMWGIVIGAGIASLVWFLWDFFIRVDREWSQEMKFIDEQQRRWNAERELEHARRLHGHEISRMRDEWNGKEFRIQKMAQEKVTRAHQECGTALRQCHEREVALISRPGGE